VVGHALAVPFRVDDHRLGRFRRHRAHSFSLPGQRRFFAGILPRRRRSSQAPGAGRAPAARVSSPRPASHKEQHAMSRLSLALLAAFALHGAAPADEKSDKLMVYLGTYTRGTKSEGIY